jgi:hypothetical protein
MSKAPRIILLPFSQTVFPKHFLKKGFALNTWPQYPVLKWLLMGPFVVLMILTIIPVIFWGIINLMINRSYDTDKSLEKYGRFLKIFADMGFGNSSEWSIESDYRNPDANKETIKILCLKNREISQFEKIVPNEFWKYADKVWVYRTDEDLFRHLKYQPFDTNESLWVKADLNNDACAFSYLNEDDAQIKPIIEQQKVDAYHQFQKLKQRHPQIQLHPNDVLPPEIVYYYEPSFDPLVNQCIQENISKIDESLATKGLQLMYWPRILLQKENLKVDAQQYATYTMPTLGGKEIESIVKELQTNNDAENKLIKNGFEQAIGMPTLDKPCFIRCVEDDFFPENKIFTYSVFPLTAEPDESILQKINFYCKIVGKNNDGPQYRIATPDESDPDAYFFYVDRLIDPAAKLAIDSIKKLDDQKILISSMAYLINTLKESHPDLCKKLNSTLYDALSKTNNTVSRLLIDEQYRIFLPDYNNLEIELGPLPKTVFIFLLRHPEGVLFKDLRPHSKELKDIYTKVGNRLDMEQIDKSILELTDPRSNSINEKCSRIKEAFLSKMADSIAQQYYVTGSRSSNKGIQLDRSLVQFPQTK